MDAAVPVKTEPEAPITEEFIIEEDPIHLAAIIPIKFEKEPVDDFNSAQAEPQPSTS